MNYNSQSLSSSSFHTSNEMINSPISNNQDTTYDSLSSQSSPQQMNHMNYQSNNERFLPASTAQFGIYPMNNQRNETIYQWNQMLSCFQNSLPHGHPNSCDNQNSIYNSYPNYFNQQPNSPYDNQSESNGPISMVIRNDVSNSPETSNRIITNDRHGNDGLITNNSSFNKNSAKDNSHSEKQTNGINKKLKNRKLRQPRTLYTDEQLKVLNQRFSQSQYLNLSERAQLANELGLKQTQIKVWYQNRRSKLKKIIKSGQDVNTVFNMSQTSSFKNENSPVNFAMESQSIKAEEEIDDSPVSILSDCQETSSRKYYNAEEMNKENTDPSFVPRPLNDPNSILNNDYANYVKNQMAWLEMGNINSVQSNSLMSAIPPYMTQYSHPTQNLPKSMFDPSLYNSNEQIIFKPYDS